MTSFRNFLVLLFLSFALGFSSSCAGKKEAADAEIGPGTPQEALENIRIAVIRHVLEDDSFREPGRMGRWFIGMGIDAEDPSDAMISRIGKTEAVRKRSAVKFERDQSVIDPESEFPAMVLHLLRVHMVSTDRADVDVETFGSGINPLIYTFNLKFNDGIWKVLKTNRPWIK